MHLLLGLVHLLLLLLLGLVHLLWLLLLGLFHLLCLLLLGPVHLQHLMKTMKVNLSYSKMGSVPASSGSGGLGVEEAMASAAALPAAFAMSSRVALSGGRGTLAEV